MSHYTPNHAGGRVVHSYGRLIPHEFPITDLQQISGPDGIGRINCTDSSGTAGFIPNSGQLDGGGVSQTRNGATTTLLVNSSNAESFQNRGLYCINSSDSFFYLFLSSTSKFTSLNTVNATEHLYQPYVHVLGYAIIIILHAYSLLWCAYIQCSSLSV